MTSSPKMPFWSEIEDLEARIPQGKLEYLRERFRNDLYDLILRKFLEQRKERNLNQAELARRLSYDPARLNRLLAAPGNWTLATVSDLLVGISGESLDLQSTSVRGHAPRNFTAQDLLRSGSELNLEGTAVEPVVSRSVSTIRTEYVQ